MSDRVEIEAKNVDKAVKKACAQYNIAENALEYEVVSYGSTGIFGLGKTRKARIRIRLDRTAPKDDPADSKETSRELHNEDDIKQNVRALIDDTFSDLGQDHPINIPVEKGRNVLEKIVDAISNEAKIEIQKSSDRVVYKVEGGNSAILIGKHGQTLEAIHTIVEKVVRKHCEGHVRVQIDIAGYMKNREQNLRKQADRLAEKCKRIGKPVTLGLMNAHDRRIVHIALKDDNAVRTQSIGDGFLRKLMIFPQKAGSSRRRH